MSKFLLDKWDNCGKNKKMSKQKDYVEAVKEIDLNFKKHYPKKQKEKECFECNGAGIIPCDCCGGIGTHVLPEGCCQDEYECSVCDGSGDIICPECNGEKLVLEEKK